MSARSAEAHRLFAVIRAPGHAGRLAMELEAEVKRRARREGGNPATASWYTA